MARLRSFALWWLALFGAFLLYQGDLAYSDRVAAAATGLIGAAAAMLVRPSLPRLPADVLRSLPRIPLQVALDFGIVTGALVRTLAGRRVEGVFVERGPLPPARRGPVGVLSGYSPNAYVLELGEDANRTVLHDLVPNRESEAPA